MKKLLLILLCTGLLQITSTTLANCNQETEHVCTDNKALCCYNIKDGEIYCDTIKAFCTDANCPKEMGVTCRSIYTDDKVS